MPVAVFSVGCVFKVDKFRWGVMANMILVTIGVAIASFGGWARGRGSPLYNKARLQPGSGMPGWWIQGCLVYGCVWR